MEDKLTTAQEAAVGFAQSLRPQDLAQVIDFDSRVKVAAGVHQRRPALEKAIRAHAAGGSTSMYNAIYIALKEMKKVTAASARRVRRQAIVVLSDGEDTSSLLSFEEVLELAKRSETAIYTIGCSRASRPRCKGFKEAEFVLRQLAQETGGRAFFPTAVEELTGDLRADRRRTVEPVHARLHLQEPEARRRVAPRRRAPAGRTSPRAPSRATTRRRVTERPTRASADVGAAGPFVLRPTATISLDDVDAPLPGVIVYIVGAGPGDPSLITVRGLRCLAAADVVVHDHRCTRACSRRAPPRAERIDVGAPRRSRVEQEAINLLLAEKAREGKRGRAPQVGRPVRVRQRRQGSAVPARAGHRLRGRARRAGARRRRRPTPACRSPIRAAATR